MIPRAEVAGMSEQQIDVCRVGPHMLPTPIGDVLVNDAHLFVHNLIEVDGRKIIALVLARGPGGMPHGMGLLTQFDCSRARHLAATLIGYADQLEAEADAQAAAALARAAGKGAA